MMSKFSLMSFFSLFTCLHSMAVPSRPVYQVISSHPHDVKEFTPFIKTIKQEGRLWLVELDAKAPAHIVKFLRPVRSDSVKHFSYSGEKFLLSSSVIQDFVSRIDANGIKQDVEMLANFKSRQAGSPDNQRATAQLKEILLGLGLEVKEFCYRAGACSIVADKKGESKPDEVIMLFGHFDSVGKNFAGADDNASGAAVLLEVARALKDYGNKRTFRYFATNGEENGLLGAEHYANELIKSGEIKKIVLGINMDMVGYNSNGIVELETDGQYESLAKWFSSLATTYTKLKTKITIGAWGSDHVPFIRGGVPTLLTIEDWSTKTPCYHMECDKPSSLNYNYAAEIAKLNMAAMMTRDDQ
jgi:hypothetical protein